MKKSLLVLISCLFVNTNIHAQSNTTNIDEINANLKSNEIVYTQKYQAIFNQPKITSVLTGCDSITTTYSSNNGLAGAMFDVIADSNLVINGIYTNLSVASGVFEIYYKYGSRVLYLQNPTAWTLLGSASVVSAGIDVPTFIPIAMNITMNAGDTVAFYVTNTNGGSSGLKYTNGVGSGTLYIDNGALKIFEGNGITYPFNSLFADRVWNGTINYCTNTTGINNLKNNNITIYPNPASDYLKFTFENNNLKTLIIKSLDGKKMFEAININTSDYIFKRNGLAKGIYFYQIYSNDIEVAKGKLILN